MPKQDGEGFLPFFGFLDYFAIYQSRQPLSTTPHWQVMRQEIEHQCYDNIDSVDLHRGAARSPSERVASFA